MDPNEWLRAQHRKNNAFLTLKNTAWACDYYAKLIDELPTLTETKYVGETVTPEHCGRCA